MFNKIHKMRTLSLVTFGSLILMSAMATTAQGESGTCSCEYTVRQCVQIVPGECSETGNTFRLCDSTQKNSASDCSYWCTPSNWHMTVLEAGGKNWAVDTYNSSVFQPAGSKQTSQQICQQWCNGGSCAGVVSATRKNMKKTQQGKSRSGK